MTVGAAPTSIALDLHLLQLAFAAFAGGLLVSALVAYPTYLILLRLKARQTISQHAPGTHQAKQGTPTMGGIIVVLGILGSLLAAGPSLPSLLVLLGFAAIGFADDFIVPRLMPGKRGLGWKQKLILQLFFAAFPIWWLARGQADVALHVAGGAFLILFFSNAYNFSDGLDGLAGSLGLILASAFVVLSIHFLDSADVTVAGAIAGTILPFLFMNAPPAKIFMGDVGSLPIGALFGLLFYRALTVGRGESSWLGLQVLALPLLILSLIMVIELVPVPLQILSVKLRKKKLFPYTPIHHAFELAGWKETRVVWIFALTQLLLAIFALALAMMLWMGYQGSMA